MATLLFLVWSCALFRLDGEARGKLTVVNLNMANTKICSHVFQVMQVVKEQITRALTIKPNSLDQFKSRLQNLSYTEILKLRQSERMNQEDFQSRPIL